MHSLDSSKHSHANALAHAHAHALAHAHTHMHTHTHTHTHAHAHAHAHALHTCMANRERSMHDRSDAALIWTLSRRAAVHTAHHTDMERLRLGECHTILLKALQYKRRAAWSLIDATRIG